MASELGARRAPRSRAHDHRHGEERRRTSVRASRTWNARSRSRVAADSPIAGADRQQPRRLRDVRGRLSTHRRALRRVDAASRERYGDAASVRFVRGNRIWIDFILGRWDEALEAADVFIAECEAGSPHTLEVLVREVRAALWLARGEPRPALRGPATGVRARAHPEARPVPAARLPRNARRRPFRRARTARRGARVRVQVPPLVREIGCTAALTSLRLVRRRSSASVTSSRDARRSRSRPDALPRWRSAIGHVLAGELDAAADIMASAGNPTDRGESPQARRPPDAGGRADEPTARRELERALAFYRSVDASFYVAQIESALAEAQRDSA